MFTRRTLFILGAGASLEVGLPLGTKLAKIIREKMDVRFERGFTPIGSGDHELYAQLKHTNRENPSELWQAAQRIGAGLGFAQSINDFLDQHRSDLAINHYGKAAIVRAVLEAERNSTLYFDRFSETEKFDPDKFADTWFTKFMYVLGRDVPRENVTEIFDNVRFIVFNYDRCLEHFLRHALQRLYSLDESDAVSVVNDLTVVHPYGSIGSLREVGFGASGANYNALAKGIKTYTEQVDAADITQQLAEEFNQAACIVFLGFAYHSQNMRLLKPPTAMNAKPIYGTAYKMSDSDVGIVTNQLIQFMKSGPSVPERRKMIKLENKLTCTELFDYYAKSLSGD